MEEFIYCVKCQNAWYDSIHVVADDLTLKQAKRLLYRLNKENPDPMNYGRRI